MGIEIDGANQKLILDSDGDTYIEGATDDTLKVYVSGAQDFTITANTLTAESGSTIAAQALTATTVTASGIVKTDDATEATSTTDGSLQTDGGLSVVKDAVFGDDIKLLSDASVIHFGTNSEVTLTHSHDSGLLLKHTATADDKPINLVLQTGETDMAADDVIGKISWQAPDEGTGTDAVLVSAAVQAVAEGNHSSSSNATSLQFMTGASEAATAKMYIKSDGKVGIGETAPLGTLHIKTGDSGQGTAQSSADTLVIEGSGNTGMNLLGGTSSNIRIAFGDSDDADAGRIMYAHSSNYMAFNTNAAEAMRIDSIGAVTKPLQPAFFGNITSAVNNETGDNTRYSYIPNELADRNGDFSTSTFTAPVAGLYLATVSHNLAGITSMESGTGMIATSNRTHYWNFNPNNLANAAGSIGFSQSQIVDMDASDTLTFDIRLTGGSKVADVEDTTTMAVFLLG